jgi:lambda family phage portal protein
VGLWDTIRGWFGAKPSAHSNQWRWSSGIRNGNIFDGSKFRGSTFYPSSWDLDVEALRDKSRVAYWDSTQARSILGRLVDNVIGTGLSLESSPIWDLIGSGMSEDEQAKLSREIELRFHLWASSHEADASGRMNFYELQALEFSNRLLDGDQVVILRYSGDSARLNPLSIQFIGAEQVFNPYDSGFVNAAKSKGNRIVEGVEVTPAGEEVAFYITDPVTISSVRVPVKGPSGRRFVLHPAVINQPGQVRGVPILAPLIHELQKITDYTVAELEASVLNAIMAVWIEPSADKNSSQPLAGIRLRGAQSPEGPQQAPPAEAKFDKPGIIIQNLKAGEKIHSYDSKRPNVNFEAFVTGITKSLSASVGIPIEVLQMSFNANYSASRASLLLFWNTVEKWREATASQFLGPIFEAWFTEEVKSGRINAVGFLDGPPVVRRAWLSAAWIGAGKPSIDPLKEANAARTRIQDGLTTRERESMIYNGSDYRDNVKRLKIENELLREANGTTEGAEAPDTQQQDEEEE